MRGRGRAEVWWRGGGRVRAPRVVLLLLLPLQEQQPLDSGLAAQRGVQEQECARAHRLRPGKQQPAVWGRTHDTAARRVAHLSGGPHSVGLSGSG